MDKRQKGFTLVELMIVAAVIGILAAIAIPNMIDMKNRPKNENHGLSMDDRSPTAGDALITMENAGFVSPVITKDWGEDLSETDCARHDKRAYNVSAMDQNEKQRHFLVCCRSTCAHKACIILFER